MDEDYADDMAQLFKTAGDTGLYMNAKKMEYTFVLITLNIFSTNIVDHIAKK